MDLAELMDVVKGYLRWLPTEVAEEYLARIRRLELESDPTGR
jgi:hypothetical protein